MASDELRRLLEENFSGSRLLPPATPDVLATLRSRLPGEIPETVRELLEYARGFELERSQLPIAAPPRWPGWTVCLSGSDDLDFSPAIPFGVPLLNDGFGNVWVVDVNADTSAWESVLYVCHDPAIVAVQASDIASFLMQLLRPAIEGADLAFVHGPAVTRIHRDDPWPVSVREARNADDAVIASFALDVPDDFNIVDLRAREIGAGFSWLRTDPATILRLGTELVFALPAKPVARLGLLRKLLRGK